MKAEEYFVTWTTLQGILIYVCFHGDQVMPCGIAWVVAIGGKKSVGHLLGCYVPTWARRQKVMTTIGKKILEHHDVVLTGGKGISTSAGFKWCKAAGFRHSRELDCLIQKKAKR